MIEKALTVNYPHLEQAIPVAQIEQRYDAMTTARKGPQRSKTREATDIEQPRMLLQRGSNYN
jgi:hypothetical protein